MEQQLQIQLPQQAMDAIASRFDIAEFCQRWQIKEFYLFGSVLREDFRSDSDIDIMVTFEENAPWGLLEFVRMKRELQNFLGREVDLVTKKSIEQSHNWIRRDEILGTAQVVYVSR
ncbi:MAG: nucleotidyltransferase family protein [Potamolinea sp.]